MIEVDEVITVVVKRLKDKCKVVAKCLVDDVTEEVYLDGYEFDLLAQEVCSIPGLRSIEIGDYIGLSDPQLARSLINVAIKQGILTIKQKGERENERKT